MICSNDDRACTCNHCRVNPVVLIATHKRVEVTGQCIDQVLKQNGKVVLVVSLTSERQYFTEKYPEIHVVMSANAPLGHKWQVGVNAAMKFTPNPLIICGSDDLLGKDFIKNLLVIMSKGAHFVGINKWWVFEKDKAYRLQYAFPNFPLGGARAYSLRLLQHLNYMIFDTKRDRQLDDKGWHDSLNSGFRCELVDADRTGLDIISIKGDWPTMNPVHKMIGHKNIRVLKTYNNARESKELLQNLLS